jgi:hypothetical protein
MSTENWYCVLHGQRRGPMSFVELTALVTSGQLKSSDRVWREGMEAWTQVAHVAEFRRHGPPARQPHLPPVPPTAMSGGPLDQHASAGQRPLENKHINPFVALAASFFCLPLGPVILGQTKKAAMVTLLTVLGLCLCLIPGMLISWMAVFENYLVAQAISEGKLVRENEYKIELLYKIVKLIDRTAFYAGH